MNYVTSIFQGRASVKSYWFVATPILIVVVAAFAFDILVLGPEFSETLVTEKNLLTGESTQTLVRKSTYGPREASAIVGWLCFLPLTIMLTRRVHDLGYPGYFAWIAVFCAFFATTFADALAFLAASVSIALGFVMAILAGIPAAIASILALIIIFFWGFSPSEPGENEYGPNPNEVPK